MVNDFIKQKEKQHSEMVEQVKNEFLTRATFIWEY